MTLWDAGQRPAFVVGHRGGRGSGWPPENTLDAFERARVEGAPAIELDVRTAADGEVVVFHDVALDRMTNGRDVRPVHDVPSSELLAIDLGGARIPRLSDVLAWARDRGVAVNVELKHDVPSRRLLAERALEIVRGARADVLISSFDPVLVGMAGAIAPRVPRAYLTYAAQPLWADALSRVARGPLVQAMHLERPQASASSVARYRRRALGVGVWTVNDAEDAVRLRAAGASWIITDAPGRIRDALAR